eukprot:CFRG0042T1
MHIDTEAIIPLPAAEYWSIRNSDEFFAIECKVLKNADKRSLESVQDASGLVIRTKLATRPDLSIVPPFLLKMIPSDDGLVFYDEIEYIYDDPVTPYAFRCKTVPSILSDKADIIGYVKIIPCDDGRSCRQVLSMDVCINAWGVGSIVETIVINGIKDAYKHLNTMVVMWKAIAASAFQKQLDELLPAWDWDNMDKKEIVHDDSLSLCSTESFYDAEEGFLNFDMPNHRLLVPNQDGISSYSETSIITQPDNMISMGMDMTMDRGSGALPNPSGMLISTTGSNTTSDTFNSSKNKSRHTRGQSQINISFDAEDDETFVNDMSRLSLQNSRSGKGHTRSQSMGNPHIVRPRRDSSDSPELSTTGFPLCVPKFR